MDENIKNKLGILEGILFVVGDEGIDIKSLSEIMQDDEENIKEYLKELKKQYEVPERGLRISYLGNAFKLTTKQEHKEYYEKLVVNPETNKLSQAAFEISFDILFILKSAYVKSPSSILEVSAFA